MLWKKPNPNALPPADVRFTELRVEPWPDGKRVRVHVTLTPFQQKPDVDATLSNAQGEEISHASIIENAEERFVFTMHILKTDPEGQYLLQAAIQYQETGVVDERQVPFEIHDNLPSQSDLS